MVAMETAICGRVALSPTHVIHPKSGLHLFQVFRIDLMLIYEFLIFQFDCFYCIV